MFLLCLYHNVTKGDWSCIQKEKLKSQEKKTSIHSFHMVKTQTSELNYSTKRAADSSSLSHLSIFFLFFYTSDVQNIIAPARSKNATTTMELTQDAAHYRVKSSSTNAWKRCNYTNWFMQLIYTISIFLAPLISSATMTCFYFKHPALYLFEEGINILT